MGCSSLSSILWGTGGRFGISCYVFAIVTWRSIRVLYNLGAAGKLIGHGIEVALPERFFRPAKIDEKPDESQV